VPRYDYECQTCQHVFEVKQSFSSEPVATCPECQNGAQRMIRAVPIVFKGSGFYVNDYGKGGGATASDPKDSENGSKSESESKSETKSESKSESKTETKAESKSDSGSGGKSESKKESKAS
jgi:putative FmdB family regulatory protein